MPSVYLLWQHRHVRHAQYNAHPRLLNTTALNINKNNEKEKEKVTGAVSNKNGVAVLRNSSWNIFCGNCECVSLPNVG